MARAPKKNKKILDKWTKMCYNKFIKREENDMDKHKDMTFIKDYEITEELHGSESFEVIVIYHRDGTVEKFYVMPE